MSIRLRALAMCGCLVVVAAMGLGMAGCKDRPPASESAGEATPSDATSAVPGESSSQALEAKALMEANEEMLPLALADLDSLSLTLTPAGPDSESFPSLWVGVGQPPGDSSPTYQATISREQAAMLVGYLAGDGLFYRSRRNQVVDAEPPEGVYYEVRAAGAQWSAVAIFALTRRRPARRLLAPDSEGHAVASENQEGSSPLDRISEAEYWIRALGQAVADRPARDTMNAFVSEFQNQCLATGQSIKPGRSGLGGGDPEKLGSLLSSLDTFKAEFTNGGSREEICRSLRLSVDPPSERERPSVLTAQLTPIQAAALAGYLIGGAGSLHLESFGISYEVFPAEPYYQVRATGNAWGLSYHNATLATQPAHAGICIPTLEFLMFLRGGLTGEAGEAMDELLEPILQEQ